MRRRLCFIALLSVLAGVLAGCTTEETRDGITIQRSHFGG